MAELTQLDIDNYKELQKAFHKTEAISDNIYPAVKDLLKPFDGSLQDTQELQRRIESLDFYLKLLINLGRDISFTGNKDESENSRLKFFNSFDNIKRSLEALNNEFIDLDDEMKYFTSDNLFLEFIGKVSLVDKEVTRKLLAGSDPGLDDKKIDALIQTWNTAIGLFVEDARNNTNSKTVPDSLIPLKPMTFVHFFRLHDNLEKVYSKLASTVTVRGFI
jgi:hypothetical protein